MRSQLQRMRYVSHVCDIRVVTSYLECLPTMPLSIQAQLTLVNAQQQEALSLVQLYSFTVVVWEQ